MATYLINFTVKFSDKPDLDAWVFSINNPLKNKAKYDMFYKTAYESYGEFLGVVFGHITSINITSVDKVK